MAKKGWKKNANLWVRGGVKWLKLSCVNHIA